MSFPEVQVWMAGGVRLHIGREACSSKNLAKELDQCCPVPLGGTGVEYRQIGDREAMARTRIGLDQMIDTCVGQRLFEAVFLFFGKRRILDGTRHIDPAADVFDEEMRTVRLIGRQIAPWNDATAANRSGSAPAAVKTALPPMQ
jgi:hypothetical protein